MHHSLAASASPWIQGICLVHLQISYLVSDHEYTVYHLHTPACGIISLGSTKNISHKDFHPEVGISLVGFVSKVSHSVNKVTSKCCSSRLKSIQCSKEYCLLAFVCTKFRTNHCPYFSFLKAVILAFIIFAAITFSKIYPATLHEILTVSLDATLP